MKVRDYETELLEIEKAYNDEQALIKQCTEKLFEDMKEPMDFFIRKEFVTGNEYTNLYKAYNFAINEVTNFKGVALVYCASLSYSIIFSEDVEYIFWCNENKIEVKDLQNMVFNFLNEKYTMEQKSSWGQLFDKYSIEIYKKDLKKEFSQKLKKEIQIKELPPKIFNPVILGMLVFAIALFLIALTVSRWSGKN